MSADLLAQAFGALGMGPSWQELQLVAETLRSSGDEEAIRIFEAGLGGDEFQALTELAVASGSSGFVALDLVTAFADPDGSPVRDGDI